jgi:hypothetical protein
MDSSRPCLNCCLYRTQVQARAVSSGLLGRLSSSSGREWGLEKGTLWCRLRVVDNGQPDSAVSQRRRGGVDGGGILDHAREYLAQGGPGLCRNHRLNAHVGRLLNGARLVLALTTSATRVAASTGSPTISKSQSLRTFQPRIYAAVTDDRAKRRHQQQRNPRNTEREIGRTWQVLPMATPTP